MLRKTLGGDRLGAGKKMKVDMHGFERSTHDLGYVWRNTQAPGTLVPFMNLLALPGDTFDIDLEADVKTHPTLGPLFASFKLQLDVFECPIRLYHGWLHNNKLLIGNDMSKVKLPQLKLVAQPLAFVEPDRYMHDPENYGSPVIPLDLQQVNPAGILSYLGIKGVGQGAWNTTYGYKNAVPFLAYWDIYKNYYANKQEEIGAVISSNNLPYASKYTNMIVTDITAGNTTLYSGTPYNANLTVDFANHDIKISVRIYGDTMDTVKEPNFTVGDSTKPGLMSSVLTAWTFTDMGGYIKGETTTTPASAIAFDKLWGIVDAYGADSLVAVTNEIGIRFFPLENIDQEREFILQHDNLTPYIVDGYSQEPYSLPLAKLKNGWSQGHMAAVCSQEGLALKTYQSDIFNNWLSTEWIDGEGGINEITAVDTSGGSFDINTLNLAQKVYDMLNRIAVSGGTYDDWLEAVYDHESFRRAETPMYYGGLSKEIIFQEVVGMAASDVSGEQPLGTLAGKGGMSHKHKGGKVTIKVNEPSVIIGIVSITPRLDYYQGNDFHTGLLTMNDLHKPSLDEIGFQDLVTDKMAFWDTQVNTYEYTYKSAGKQPAWVDYMTNYNRIHGNFADERSEMFMTLARRYEFDADTESIKDLTTYIDPTKFNYAFAQTDLTAQNFWVQIGCDITARRKMSAKLMPNL